LVAQTGWFWVSGADCHSQSRQHYACGAGTYHHIW
jgi:hypothetical protein